MAIPVMTAAGQADRTKPWSLADGKGRQTDAALATIVIINHNYGAYLEAAIESAFRQTYPACEIVVVDDGSIDHSRDIIARYEDRIKPVLQDPGGHSVAANAGFNASSGEFVLFLDADDILYENCIAEAIAAWSPGDAKIQFQLDTIDAAGRNKDMVFPYFSQALTRELILDQALRSGWYPWTVSTGNIFHRAFLEQMLPLDAGTIYRSPDGYLNKLAPLYGHVGTLRRTLGAYRVHGANAWASQEQPWDAGKAARWLRFNTVLRDAFLARATQRGFDVRNPLIPSFHELEYRLFVLRFGTLADRVQPDNRLKVLRDGSVWLLEARADGLIGRIARYVWLMFLASMPLPVVKSQIAKARTQSGRSPFWRTTLRLARDLSGRR